MPNNLEKYTTELWESAVNGRITEKWNRGVCRISSVEINGSELKEYYDDIERYWLNLKPNYICHINTMDGLYVSAGDGLWVTGDSFRAKNIVSDKTYHLCVSAFGFYENKETAAMALYICDNNSVFEKWINQPIFDSEEFQKRKEEITANILSEFKKWETENVSEEVVEYTHAAYRRYCERDISYEEFVTDFGYIDGTYNEADVYDSADDMIREELEEFYGLDN